MLLDQHFRGFFVFIYFAKQGKIMPFGTKLGPKNNRKSARLLHIITHSSNPDIVLDGSQGIKELTE